MNLKNLRPTLAAFALLASTACAQQPPAETGSTDSASASDATSADPQAGMTDDTSAMGTTTADASAMQDQAATGTTMGNDPAMGQGMQNDGMQGQGMQGQGMQGQGDMQAGSDRAFYQQALASGTGEAALSEHAANNASSQEVRALGRMLAEDHAALNAKLMAASGMASAAPKPEDKAKHDRVMAQEGEAFDRAFLDHMAMGHEKSIALYQNASRSATSAQTRQLAEQALPKLRQHAARVQELRGGRDASSATTR